MKYQDLPTKKLIKVLKKLHNYLLYGSGYPSLYTLKMFTHKITGKDPKSLISLNFLQQAYHENERMLFDEILDENNIKIPKLKKYEIESIDQNSFKRVYHYKYEIESYSTDERVLTEIAEGSLFEGSDPYYNKSAFYTENLETNYGNFEISSINDVNKKIEK